MNLTLSLLFSVILSLFGQSGTEEYSRDKITWNKMIHDFDTIPEGEQVSTSFICYNHSDTALVIENVQWSCGCMVANWKREAIQAGDSTVIRVSFNASGKSGRQHKVIAVYSNQGLFELFIQAYIRRKK